MWWIAIPPTVDYLDLPQGGTSFPLQQLLHCCCVHSGFFLSGRRVNGQEVMPFGTHLETQLGRLCAEGSVRRTGQSTACWCVLVLCGCGHHSLYSACRPVSGRIFTHLRLSSRTFFVRAPLSSRTRDRDKLSISISGVKARLEQPDTSSLRCETCQHLMSQRTTQPFPTNVGCCGGNPSLPRSPRVWVVGHRLSPPSPVVGSHSGWGWPGSTMLMSVWISLLVIFHHPVAESSGALVR